MKKQTCSILCLLAITAFILPLKANAASIDMAGWLPYWASEEGITEVEDNLLKLDRIHLFIYEVNYQGELVAKADIDKTPWRSLMRTAHRRRTEIVPTISWFNGQEIHDVLSNPQLRQQHVQQIVELVDKHDFDGIDIDYESKLAITKDHFSLFLSELKDKLGKDLLTCTIEPRTPAESKWRTIPNTTQHANDYQQIAKYCDEITIMAYDQQRIDWQLNDTASGQPYIPVADPQWVSKVLDLALKDFDHSQVVLGIPTYGRIWELQVAPNWFKEYSNIRSINYSEATALAESLAITPGGNQAQEQSFTYFPPDSIFSLLNQLPTPLNTPKQNAAAAKALLFANFTGMTVPVNVVWYTDQNAINNKLELAEDYNLKGVSFFKLDGELPDGFWSQL